MTDFMDWLRGITPGSISSPQGTPGVVTDPSAPYSAAQPVAPDPIPPNLGPRAGAPAPAGPNTPFVPPQPAVPDNGLPIGPGGLPNIGAMLENIKNAPPTPAQSAPVDAPPAAPAPAVPPLSPPAPIGAGAGLAPDVAANAPPATSAPTPLAPAPDAGPAAPSDTPAGKSLLERILGSSDPSTKDASGLTSADRHGLAFDSLAKLGFGIMAASMPQNPNQRAQAIQQLGNIPASMLKERAAMIGEQAQAQRVQLGQQQLTQRQAGIDYLKGPEAQKAIATMPASMQGVAQMIAKTGDMAAFGRLAQAAAVASNPRSIGNGNLYVPNANGQAGGTVVNPGWGTSTLVGGSPGAADPGVAGPGAAPAPAGTPGAAPPVAPGAQPGASKYNEAAIAQLPLDRQELIRGIVAGDIDPKSVSSRNGDQAFAVAKAREYSNNTWSQDTYANRQKSVQQLNQEFYGAGKTAKNITALDTAYGHIGLLSDLTKDLNGSNPQLVNQAVSKLNTAFGGTKYTAAEMTSGAVSHEMAKVFRDTGMSNEDAQEWAGRLNVGKTSGPQMQAAINSALTLIEERKKALETQYKRGGGKRDTGEWFTPEHVAKADAIRQQYAQQNPGAPGTMAPAAGPTQAARPTPAQARAELARRQQGQ